MTKLLFWITTCLVILVIGYWNIHYGTVIWENQNFPQITGAALFVLIEVFTIHRSIKFLKNEIIS